MTYYKRLSNDITEAADGTHTYQGITLTHFENKITDVSYNYQSVINLLIENAQARFADVQNSTVFKSIVRLLDLKTWPTTPNSSFCENEISELISDFKDLLSLNNCDISSIHKEWATLQTYLMPIVANNPNEHYLKLWSKVLTNTEIKTECKNVLHIFEILLCTPFTNAKVERGFSRMARVKTDFRNQLGRERLSACFRISEEGSSITDFNPDPAIELWYNDKVRRLGSSSHKYKKRSKIVGNDSVPELSTSSISDLESDSDNDSSSAD